MTDVAIAEPIAPAEPVAPAAVATPPVADPAPPAPAAVADPTPAPAQDGAPPAVVPVVPETYDLTVPEGCDEVDRDTVAALAKSKGWTNEDAQAVLNDHAAELVAQRARFRAGLEADPVLGGANLEATDLNVRRALDHYAPETDADGKALRGFLAKTGFGNQRLVVGLLARLGKDLHEDNPVRGGGQPTAPKGDAMSRLGATLIPQPKG